jgi:trimethylamine--corrinoid protein Co-methyltransferase
MVRLTFLEEAEIDAIHNASLRILDETGIFLNEKSSCAVLQESGARRDGDRILIPPELVDHCIALSGKKTSIQGRNGSKRILGDGSLHFHNLGGAPWVYDPETGRRRQAVIQDVCDATRLLDALPNCHTITPFFTPTDVDGRIMSLAMYRYALPNTTKPLQGPGIQRSDEVLQAYRMAEVVGNPHEILTLSLSPVSPLTIPAHEAGAIMDAWGSHLVLCHVQPPEQQLHFRSPEPSRSRMQRSWQPLFWRN